MRLLIRIESDTLTHTPAKQLGSGHDEVGVHHFAFRDLTCDPLETISDGVACKLRRRGRHRLPSTLQ